MSKEADGPARTNRRTSVEIDVEDAADAHLAMMAEHDVEYFFCSPGTEFAPYWEHFADQGRVLDDDGTQSVRYVNCRHEELAVHMAAGYAAVTGRPQVVALHVNSGMLHAGMSIHGAFQAGIPMLILASHAATHEREVEGGTPGSHYLQFNEAGGHESLYERYVKWVTNCDTNANIGRYFARAFSIAETTPRGPVFMNVAREAIFEDLDRTTVCREVPSEPPTPGGERLDSLAGRLEDAGNPMFVVGNVGRTPEASAALVRLAERLEAPVLERGKWTNCFPSDHRLYLGAEWFVDHYLGMDPDLVVVVESLKPWYPPEGGAPDAEIVFIDSDPLHDSLDYWNYPADELLPGEPAAVLPELARRVSPTEKRRPVDWSREHERLRAHWRGRARRGEDSVPIDPFWLAHELDRLLPDDAIVTNETITHRQLVANLIESRDRIYLPGLKFAGGNGGGLDVTLGAKLAEPDRTAVALEGDGCFNYNPVTAALGAAQEHDLPMLVVLFDNEGYQAMRRSHSRSFPDGRAAERQWYPGTPIQPKPNYERLIETWGGHGETVKHPSDIEGAVRNGLEAVADGRSALVDVVLDEEPPRLEPPTGA